MDKMLLMSAKQEILSLRKRNEILSAQVGVIEVFAAALGLRNGNHGMSVDVAWELDRAIAELEAASAAAKE